MNSEEFRKKAKLKDEELELVIKNINKNMEDYDKNFKTRIEQTDIAERRMYSAIFFENIEL